VGVSRDGPNFFEYSILSQERVKLRTSNLVGIFTGSSEQKPLKNLGEKGAWAYPGTAQIFGVGLPRIISGTGKAIRTSNMAGIFTESIRAKSP